MTMRLRRFVGSSLASPLVLAAALAGVGCTREGGAQAQEAPQGAEPVSPDRVGFYAFDGTGMSGEHGGVIHDMFSRARVRTKAYFNGPDLSGSATRSIIERAKARVCNDWRRGRIDTLSLAGYSRGAVIALAVAHELLMPASGGPGGKSGGCANVDSKTAGTPNGTAVIPASLHARLFSYLGRGDSPAIANLSLLDAVNTLNVDIGERTLTGLLALSPGTRCFHYVKADRSEGPLGVLNTLSLPACETGTGPEGTSHQGLANLGQAREALEAKALAGDLIFEAAPRYETLAVADYRALCPRINESAQGAGDGYERCNKSLCEWDGRPSGPGICKAPTQLRADIPEGFSTADETGSSTLH